MATFPQSFLLALTLSSVALGSLAPATALAERALTANQIIGQMKNAMEPPKASLRRMTLTARDGSEETSLDLLQARRTFPDGARSLTVVLNPEGVRGIAYLVEQRRDGTGNTEYVYMPVIRRARKLLPTESYTAFLDTDFSYGDLGLLPIETQNELGDETTVKGRKTYEVESTTGPVEEQWYVKRTVTFIDAETLLPIKRNFYNPANSLFKTETFVESMQVDGIPSPSLIVMQNLGTRTNSVLQTTSLSYNDDIAEELFTPEKLSVVGGILAKSKSAPNPTPAGH